MTTRNKIKQNTRRRKKTVSGKTITVSPSKLFSGEVLWTVWPFRKHFNTQSEAIEYGRKRAIAASKTLLVYRIDGSLRSIDNFSKELEW